MEVRKMLIYDYTFIVANGYKSDVARERDIGQSPEGSQMWSFYVIRTCHPFGPQLDDYKSEKLTWELQCPEILLEERGHYIGMVDWITDPGI